MRSTGPDQASRGSATITMLAGIGVLALITVVALAVGLASQTRHRAEAAADAAALAAATAAVEGAPAACDRGRELAERNGGELIRCVMTDGISDVTVSVSPPGLLARFGVATARARAGPASAASR